jgi:hypothetical protein
MKSYLEEKLPLIYQECYEGISQVISRSWEMINDQNTPSQTRVALLGLVADAIQTKLDISCGGEVIENGIKYAQQNIKNRFVSIAKPEEILHPTATTSDSEEEDIQQQQNQQQQNQQSDDNNNLATKNNKQEDRGREEESNTDNNSNNNNNRRTKNSVF